MKQTYPLFFFILAFAGTTTAQIDQPSVGPGYLLHTFYSLADGATTQHSYADWDIAFSTGGRDLAVFVNEAVGISRSEELPVLELFYSGSTDFDNVDTTGMRRLYNDERSWAEGAFNHVKSASDPLDFGWGTYNPINNDVEGTRSYVIKLRSGGLKKIEIQLLSQNQYTFRYADLDGENEVVETINKADYAGKTLVYYSFESGEVLDLEPDSWDLSFGRYATPLNAGMGDTLEYIVTGVLTNQEVEVAKAEGIDPMTVEASEYEGTLSSDSLTIIGFDWKAFDLNTFQWSIPADRVYFVKTADNSLWKVQFLDFEGSSTGVSTLEKTFEGILTSTEDDFRHLHAFEVFPNPASEVVNIGLELKGISSRQEGTLELSNALGQILQTHRIRMDEGLNIRTLPLDRLAPGMYNVSLHTENKVITRSLLVK